MAGGDLEEDIRRVETYIAEHGQVTGTISWQMARDSFDAIRAVVDAAQAVCLLVERENQVSMYWEEFDVLANALGLPDLV